MIYRRKPKRCTAMQLTDDTAETLSKIHEWLDRDIEMGYDDFYADKPFYIHFTDDSDCHHYANIGDYIVWDDDFCEFFTIPKDLFEEHWELVDDQEDSKN